MSTDPKRIEAVARALCKINGHDPDWPASHFSDHKLWTKNAEDAQTIITAYEAARGDGVWVPREALAKVMENVGNDDGPRTHDGWRSEELQTAIDEVDRAMIAAAKGE